MTKEDINIIDIIKRNSKLTHSDLSLDEKEFAKHKNVLELLEKASEVSTDLRAKLEKFGNKIKKALECGSVFISENTFVKKNTPIV